jgi:salicylate hydroxylase
LRAGFDVQVYEQASELKDTGAGINIGPNASRILYRLGIPHELERTSVKPATFDQRRWDDGRLLLRSPLGEAVEAGFGAPHYTLHRGDLHRALRGVIPPARMHLGHRFVGHKGRGDRVEAYPENGTSVSADVLVGPRRNSFRPTPCDVRHRRAAIHRPRGGGGRRRRRAR